MRAHTYTVLSLRREYLGQGLALHQSMGTRDIMVHCVPKEQNADAE